MKQSKKQTKTTSKRTPNKRTTASKAMKRTPNRRATASKAMKTKGKRTPNKRATASKAKKVVKRTGKTNSGMSRMLNKRRSPARKACEDNVTASALSIMFKQKN